MISLRFVWPIVGLLLLALVPTALNKYADPEPLRAGELAARIPARLSGFRGPTDGKRTAAWAKDKFGVTDFVSRLYTSATGTKYELFATRSHDTEKLFHLPEKALSYGSSANEQHIDTVETAMGSLPVHVIGFTSSAGEHRAMYVLLYGRRGVEHPILFMLARIPELFVGRREAMMLIYVQGSGAPKEQLEKELKQLLAGACKLK